MSIYTCYCRTYQAIMRVAVNFMDWTPPKLIEGDDSMMAQGLV